jgi:hypothetical protein
MICLTRRAISDRPYVVASPRDVPPGRKFTPHPTGSDGNPYTHTVDFQARPPAVTSHTPRGGPLGGSRV